MLYSRPPMIPARRTLWDVAVLLGALCLGVSAAAFLVVWPFLPRPHRPDPDQLKGGMVTYRLLFPEGFRGDRAAAVERTVTVMTGRLRAGRIAKFRAFARGNSVSVELDGVDRAGFDRCKALLALDSVELREVAPASVHQAWKAGEPAPEGFMAVPNDRKEANEYAYLGGDEILVSRETIVDGSDVRSAQASKDLEREAWKVEFELTDGGAGKFDDTAARLYRHEPHGRIAILRNGRVHSKPIINAEHLGGRGVIGGAFSQDEAENLAIVLRTGGLPVPIGRVEKGAPEPGVPEFESYVDLTETGR